MKNDRVNFINEKFVNRKKKIEKKKSIADVEEPLYLISQNKKMTSKVQIMCIVQVPKAMTEKKKIF